MRHVDILIPTYSRQKVFGHTLDSIATTILDRYDYNIEVTVHAGILDNNAQRAVDECDRVYYTYGLDVDYICYRDNIGKARCLNDMFKRLHNPEWVITLDNDMVFTNNWIHIIDAAIAARDILSWDYVGFGGRHCFIHLPDRLQDTTTYEYVHKKRTYYLSQPYGIGGGMLLFHSDFLKNWVWKNNGGGVYLGDDARLSAAVRDKFVLYYDSKWILHDPYGTQYPEYCQYYQRKEQQTTAGQEVYQKGWDK